MESPVILYSNFDFKSVSVMEITMCVRQRHREREREREMRWRERDMGLGGERYGGRGWGDRDGERRIKRDRKGGRKENDK